jgi:general secretion pathway protein F/type IV pilus assembly protein PilC
MPDYIFDAMANSGLRSSGTLNAASEREAQSILDARGLFPLRIELAKKSAALAASTRRVGSRAMATFYGQLADLLRAGVPLLRSLELLMKQQGQPLLSEVLADVHGKVADGVSLADAMARHPRTFNELSISMVRAGQEGGFLEDVLERIAHFTENQEDLKAKVIGAMAYPIFLAIMGFAVLLVLVVFFIPKFEPVFKRLEEKNDLPPLTVMLIGFSNFILSYWWLMLGVGAAAVFGFLAWARTPTGRESLDAFRLRVPLAGKVYLSFALSRFTRILGTLLHNGIPILQALRISKDSTGNVVLSKAIDRAADNVTAGNSLAQPLRLCPYFPSEVVEMVAVAEESNQLEKVLLDIANGMEKRTGRQLELFVRLLEPIMLLVMAGVTLVVVAGLLLPVFKMSSAVRR